MRINPGVPGRQWAETGRVALGRCACEHKECASHAHVTSGPGGRGVGRRPLRGACRRSRGALAPDQSAARAGRARLRVEPRLVGPGSVERDREVDARCDVRVLSVEAAHGRPTQRVEEDERTARVEPRVGEGRRGTNRYQSPTTGAAGARFSQSSDPRHRGAGRSCPRTGTSARCPPRPCRSAADSSVSGRGTCGISVTSCSRPATSPTDQTMASKIGLPDCVIDTRIDSAALRPRASVVTSRSTGVSKSATPRKWATSVAGRSNREQAPAARNAIAAM